MNRSAGIRIRQTGGLGSNAGLMMNGFQDRAIKNFKDGIPMDYLGAGYNIGARACEYARTRGGVQGRAAHGPRRRRAGRGGEPGHEEITVPVCRSIVRN